MNLVVSMNSVIYRYVIVIYVGVRLVRCWCMMLVVNGNKLVIK